MSAAALYEDNLYLSNLYEFLDTPTMTPGGTATSGPNPGDGVRFEHVEFAYPGSHEIALAGIDLHIPPGSKLAIVGENGSGKTTSPTSSMPHAPPPTPTGGRITLDGRDLQRVGSCFDAKHRRIGAFIIFFRTSCAISSRLGENIGAGDDRAVRGSRPLGRSRRTRGARQAVHHHDVPVDSSTRSSASGSRMVASSRSASGRRSRSRDRSCARTRTSSCSTSRPRRWTPRPRSASSSASGSSPTTRSRS